MDYSQEYFTIENLGIGTNTLTIVKENIPHYTDGTSDGVDYFQGDPTGSADAAPTINTIYYSFDKTTWTPLGTTSTTALTVDFTDKIYLKATCNKWATQLEASKIWCSTNTIGCADLHCFSGNIMSLVHGDNFVNDNTLTETYALAGIFYNNTTLINIDNLILSCEYPSAAAYIMMFYGCSRLTTLPETLFSCIKELNNNCFRLMFVHCSGLTSVPKKLLPFKTLVRYCYNGMFYECTSLTNAPDLPATTLEYGCYYTMFRGCSMLTIAPDLPATTLENRCYYCMFDKCTSLVHSPKMHPTIVNIYSCYGMFRGCTSLIDAPNLPATTLSERCYMGMFEGCSSLVHSPKMYPNSIGSYSCAFMFNNCSSLLEPVNLPAPSVAEYGCYCMFQNCENLQYFPALPATTLAPFCYYYMFYNCKTASNVINLPATTMFEKCYMMMFANCSSLTQAPELPAMTLAKECYNNMFWACTSLLQAPKLKATVIPEGAYKDMFDGCMNLNYVECQALDISAVPVDPDTGFAPTYRWLRSVMPVGTFVQHINMNSWTRGISGIPTGWNVLFVDENGTTFSSEVKTQHVFENAIVKDFKDLTVQQTEMSSSPFRMFTNINYINFNGYDYVDLGLPSGTLWATINLGALNPEDVGDEFRWGASSPDGRSPYNSRTANKLPLEHDTANIYMGGDWHIPTPSQLYELIDYTTQQKVTINGHIVAKFTSNINGNFVIFPIADYWSNKVVSHYDGDEMIEVMEVYTYDDDVDTDNDYQCFNSCNVRAVIDAPPQPLPLIPV